MTTAMSAAVALVRYAARENPVIILDETDARIVIAELGGENASLGSIQLVASEYAALRDVLARCTRVSVATVCHARALILALKPQTPICVKCGHPAIRLVDGAVVGRTVGSACEMGCGESRTRPLAPIRYHLTPSRDWHSLHHNPGLAIGYVLEKAAPNIAAVRAALASIEGVDDVIKARVDEGASLGTFAQQLGEAARWTNVWAEPFFRAIADAFPQHAGDVVAVARLANIELVLPEPVGNADASLATGTDAEFTEREKHILERFTKLTTGMFDAVVLFHVKRGSIPEHGAMKDRALALLRYGIDNGCLDKLVEAAREQAPALFEGL